MEKRRLELAKRYINEINEFLSDRTYSDWQNIVRTRDKMTHYYEKLDQELICDSVEKDISELLVVINDLLDKEYSRQNYQQDMSL